MRTQDSTFQGPIIKQAEPIVNRQTLLLIGMDEAGYGPKLGPVCHGYCAIRCQADHGSIPNLWELLHPCVMRHPAGAGSIAIDDSKAIYSAGRGLEKLVQGVGAFLECVASEAQPSNLYQILLPESDRLKLAEDAWGCPADGDFGGHDPIAQQSGSCPPKSLTGGSAGEKLREALARAGAQVVALGARALSAKHFNAALDRTGNKAEVSWQVLAAQLELLLKLALPGEEIFVAIDRQGGRKFYAAHVGALFPGVFPGIERETKTDSTYRFETGERTARVSFLVEGERQALPIALSSMAAKLAREFCMHNFNAYFKGQVPELKPTAGYCSDAHRFLRETAPCRLRLGIVERDLVRDK